MKKNPNSSILDQSERANSRVFHSSSGHRKHSPNDALQKIYGRSGRVAKDKSQTRLRLFEERGREREREREFWGLVSAAILRFIRA